MTRTQRQNVFDRLFPALAKHHAESLGLGYAGTIRKLPPPPLPGEKLGATRYYVNAISLDGSGTRLVEFNEKLYAALRHASEWVETGKGPRPSMDAAVGSAASVRRQASKRRKV